MASETVLLAEGYGAHQRVRPIQLAQPHIREVVEEPPMPNAGPMRIWRQANGEVWHTTTGTALRVFREVLPPAPPEAPENPRYDELVVKNLRLHPDETPNGFRRKHLRKQ